MPTTIEIRDIDDAVYEALGRRAAQFGLSLPEFLRQEITRIASHVRLAEYLSGTDGDDAATSPDAGDAQGM